VKATEHARDCDRLGRSAPAIALLVVACGRAPSSALPVGPYNRASSAAAGPGCIVPGSWPAIDSVAITDDAVELCIDDPDGHQPHQPRTCFHVDLATGAYRPAPIHARPSAHEPERVTGAWASIDDDGVHLCSRTGASTEPTCRTLRPAGLDLDDGWYVASNADGSRFIPCHTGGCSPLDVRDGSTGALLQSIAPWNTGMGQPATFQMGFFVGDDVLALISDTPVASEGRLFDGRGNLVLKFGEVAEHEPHPLGDGRWAIETWEAGELLVLDAKRTKLAATYPLRPLAIPESIDGSNPLVAAAVARADGGITALLAHGVVGHVVLFAADQAVPPRVLRPPMCAVTL
jgi:hypothetical protein